MICHATVRPGCSARRALGYSAASTSTLLRLLSRLLACVAAMSAPALLACPAAFAALRNSTLFLGTIFSQRHLTEDDSTGMTTVP